MRLALIGCLIATALSPAACHTMKPVTVDQLTALRPAQVRVTSDDQDTVVIEGPQIVQGRLVGWVDGEYRVMPVGDVQRILMPAPAPRRTAALVAATAIGVAGIAYLVAGAGRGDPMADLNCNDRSLEDECQGIP
jgi:hypothetical protein